MRSRTPSTSILSPSKLREGGRMFGLEVCVTEQRARIVVALVDQQHDDRDGNLNAASSQYDNFGSDQ